MHLPHVRYVLTSDVINKEEANRVKLIKKFGLCLKSDGRYYKAEAQLAEVF